MMDTRSQIVGIVFRMPSMNHTDVVFLKKPRKIDANTNLAGNYEYLSHWAKVNLNSLNVIISEFQIPLSDMKQEFKHLKDEVRGNARNLATYGYIVLREKTIDLCRSLGNEHELSRKIIDEKSHAAAMIEHRIIENKFMEGYIAKNLETGEEFFISKFDLAATEQLTE